MFSDRSENNNTQNDRQKERDSWIIISPNGVQNEEDEVL